MALKCLRFIQDCFRIRWRGGGGAQLITLCGFSELWQIPAKAASGRIHWLRERRCSPSRWRWHSGKSVGCLLTSGEIKMQRKGMSEISWLSTCLFSRESQPVECCSAHSEYTWPFDNSGSNLLATPKDVPHSCPGDVLIQQNWWSELTKTSLSSRTVFREGSQVSRWTVEIIVYGTDQEENSSPSGMLVVLMGWNIQLSQSPDCPRLCWNVSPKNNLSGVQLHLQTMDCTLSELQISMASRNCSPLLPTPAFTSDRAPHPLAPPHLFTSVFLPALIKGLSCLILTVLWALSLVDPCRRFLSARSLNKHTEAILFAILFGQ